MSKYIYDGFCNMRNKDKGRKWDGKSRVSNDMYRKNFDEIFKKKSHNKKEDTEKLLKEIEERNGF